MANLKPKARPRKAATSDAAPEEALEELARAIAKWARAIGHVPPDYVMHALEAMQAALADRSGIVAQQNQARAKVDDLLESDSDLAVSKRRGRHDEKALPTGYTYEAGHLVGPPLVFKKPEVSTEDAARSLLLSLACDFNLADASGRPHQLYAHVHRQIKAATPSGRLHKRADAIDKMYEAYFGERQGTPRWVGALVAQLEMDARHREEERQRALRGDPHPDELIRDLPGIGDLLAKSAEIPSGALLDSASGSAIRAFLLHARVDLPEELTGDAIDAMRGAIGLNGRGRGGKRTADSVVRAFAQELKRRARE